MKLPQPHSLSEIAALINATAAGNPDHLITGLNEIHKVEPGDIVFVDHPKYYEKALNSAATTVLINKEVEIPEGKALLISDDPFRDFNFLTRHFRPEVHLSEQQQSDGSVGAGTLIHPGAVIGDRVVIGKDCRIGPGVVIHSDARIGDRVIIHPNVVIGGDAFYYKRRPAPVGYEKMHTCGSVVIGDDVEIGALSTIDRGVTGDTRIGSGTKIDNHVHIGHDTVVGERCLFAAQVGIAGCVIIEDEVILWGQVGVPSDRRIGKAAVVLGQSGVLSDIEPGKTFFGSPADEARTRWRELASLRKLPDLMDKLKA